MTAPTDTENGGAAGSPAALEMALVELGGLRVMLRAAQGIAAMEMTPDLWQALRIVLGVQTGTSGTPPFGS